MEQNTQNDDLLTRAQKGEDSALCEIYLANKNLIYSLLKRYHYSQEESEDLFQVASLGLVKAIQNFEPKYGYQFSTYAVPLILGEIRRYFREISSLKVSRTLKETSKKIIDFENTFIQENGKEPTIEDIAFNLNLPHETIMLAIEASYKPTSLDQTFADNDDLTLLDMVKEEREPMVDRYLDLDIALTCLDKKERLFVHLRYFENLTQQQIATRLFTNQVSISRLEKTVLAKMRDRLLKEVS